MPRPKNNRETEGIRCMIHQHLQRRAMVAPLVAADVHLDEDALSAFVEGRLTEAESAPVIQHLVGCGLCRRTTAQLVRLESEIGPAEVSAPDQAHDEPGRVRSLLDDLSSRVLPQPEGDAVFAYHAPATDFKTNTETDASEPSSDKSEDENKGDEAKNESPEQ